MTTTQKNAITGVQGLQLYDTTLNAPQYYDGSAWQTIGNVSTTGLTNNYATKYNG